MLVVGRLWPSGDYNDGGDDGGIMMMALFDSGDFQRLSISLDKDQILPTSYPTQRTINSLHNDKKFSP